MAHTQNVTIRASSDLVERLDELVPRMQADPRYRSFPRIGRATVIRLALERGAALLEVDLPPDESEVKQ